MVSIKNLQSKYGEYEKKKYFYLAASVPWMIYSLYMALYFIKGGFIGFEGNDDIYMGMISGGAYGEFYARNIYNNVVLGWIYTLFYRLSPSHNWNTWVQLMVVFSTYTIFGVWCVHKFKLVKGYLAALLFTWATRESMICKLTYSKTGGFAIALGCILLLSSLDSEKWKTWQLRCVRILGCIYIFFGGIFRKDTLLSCLPFLLLGAVYLGIKYKKQWLRLLPFGVLAVVLGACWIGNAVAYSADEDWKYFTEYNDARTALLDYELPNYGVNEKEFEALGYSLNDYNAFKLWIYAEKQVFSLESLQKMVSLQGQYKPPLTMKEQIDKYFDSFVFYAKRHVIIFVFLFLFLGCAAIGKREQFWYQLIVFALGAGELFALIYVDRLVLRAVYTCIPIALMMLLFFTDTSETETKMDIRAMILLAFISVFAYYGGNNTTLEESFYGKEFHSEIPEQLFGYTSSHKENLYVIDIYDDADIFYAQYSALDHPAMIDHSNVAMLGGWFIPSPINANIAGKYGDPYNLLTLLGTQDNVYWIASENGNTYITTYMWEHFGKNEVLVDEVAGYCIYRFE